MGLFDQFKQAAQEKVLEFAMNNPEAAQTALETVAKVQADVEAAKAGETVDFKATAKEVKAAAVKIFKGFGK